MHRVWLLVIVGVWMGPSGCATEAPSRSTAHGRDSAVPEAATDAEDAASPTDAARPRDAARPPTDGQVPGLDASNVGDDAAGGRDGGMSAPDAAAPPDAGTPDAATAEDAGLDAQVTQGGTGPLDASRDANPPPVCAPQVQVAETGEDTDPLSMLDAFVCDAWKLCCEESCHGTGALESCLDTREAQNGRLREQIESGRVRLDPTRVRGCVADLRAASVSCVPALRAVRQVDSPVACPGAFVGTVPTGEACLDDRECAPAGVARSICVQGFCFPASPGQLGDPCYVTLGLDGVFWTNDEGATGPAACSFEDGLHCHPTQGVCAPTLTEGAPCAVDQQCGGALCLGTCLTPRAAGAACDPARDTCEQGACAGGYCVPFSRTDCEGNP